ncbi:MAG: MSCRAMM family adhesin SdrC [Lachnospiraceae bacterium]|nr:MSCRAMM family adhesin SdrC [Lachnospiraceae bacterium]
MNVVKASATVTFTGNYSGAASATFTIEARTLTAEDFALESDSVVYNGSEQTPAVILANGLNLAEGTDYSVAYSDNENVGTATVTIKGSDENCTGSVELTFEITGSDVSENVKVTVADGSYVYTGEAIEPEVTVIRDKSVLTEGEDYTVTYSNNINASTEESTATVTVTLTGNYSGTVMTEHFTIEKAEQTLVMRNDGTIIAEIGETLDLATLIEDSSSYAGTLLFAPKSGSVNLIGTGNTVLNIISELEAGTELELTVYAPGTTNYNASETVTFTVTAVARTSITIDSDNADVVVYERTTETDEDGEVQTVDTLLSADAETGVYSAKQGMTISFTVTPESGYGLPNVTVNGETVEPDENGYYVVELTAELLAEDSDLVISVSVKRTSWDESSGDTADADIESIIASVAAGTQAEDADGSTYEDSLDYNDDGKNDLLDILNILYRTEEWDTDSTDETVEEAVSEDATEDAAETSEGASEDASDEDSDESSDEAAAGSDSEAADDSGADTGADSEAASGDAAE